MRTVVFDLDGTLADTSGDLIAAANACFEGMGIATRLCPEGDALTAFHGGRAMLRLGLEREGLAEQIAAEQMLEEWYPRLLAFYAEKIDLHTRLYPGAREAVTALRAAGYRTSVCTNKPEALAEVLLTRLGVRDLFGALVGADTLPVRKPDPAPYVAAVDRAGGDVAQSLLVGDTLTDRRTAAAAGVPCILVGFGPSGDAVRDMAPEAVIAGYDALAEEVRRLIG
ncbi:HAD-IA family hydrolase [Salipiger marinus]|uniref:HAD-IA family hydrolase n=1 Tax=Salipiger marinus TaxID=555512 RepID=UPI00405A3256